jgi:hypothetical protein
MSLFPLKHFPEDVRKRILEVQFKMKTKKGIAQYSIERTIHQIIKEHQQMELLLSQPNTEQGKS